MYNFLELAYIAMDKNKKLPRVYTFQFKEKDYIGLNTVFSPIVYEDTFFFLQHIPIVQGGSFLEIGCGTGIISVNAAASGYEKVVATDINPDAIIAAKLNAVLHQVETKMDIFVSNIFQYIKPSLYNVIFWNAPFIHHQKEGLSLIEKSVMGNYTEGISTYISTAKSFLAPKGRVFLGFSSTCGDLDLLREICAQSQADLSLLATQVIEEIEVEFFEIVYR